MLIALVVFYGQASIVFRVFRDGRKSRLKLAHAAIHTIALILTIVALESVFQSHNMRVVKVATQDSKEQTMPHLFSIHSWLGISVVFMYACQWLFGIIILLFPTASERVRQMYLPIHRFFGGGLFVSATGVSLMGLQQFMVETPNYINIPAPLEVGNSLGLMVFLHAAAIVYMLVKDEYKRAPLASD